MPVSPLWKRKPTSNRSQARSSSTVRRMPPNSLTLDDDRVGHAAARPPCARSIDVGRERGAGGGPQRGHLLVRLDRILVVADVVGVEAAQRVAGGRHRPAAVRVQPQLAVGADRRAHLAHHLHLLVEGDGRDLALEPVGVVLGDHPGAVAGHLERASTRPAPTGRQAQREVLRQPDVAADGAAEQRRQRPPLGAAAGVPQRHLDAAEHAPVAERVAPRRVAHGRTQRAPPR